MENALVGEMQALNVGGRQKVVVDGLNYLGFFTPSMKEPLYGHSECFPWKMLAVTRCRVRAFLQGCREAGLETIFVIDKGQESEEAVEKWKDRREKEVKKEMRAQPYRADATLAVCLREEGVEVIQAAGYDADDIVAKLAIERGAYVLSGDRDMLRYRELDRDGTNRIFISFAFERRKVKLIPRRDFDLRGREERDLGGISLDDIEKWSVPQSKIVFEGTYRRGNTDSFTKRLGNLHLTARPLRQAMYARMGCSTVEELIPTFSEGRVVWNTDVVEADGTLDALLDDPADAMAWLQQADAGGPGLEHEWEEAWRSYSRAMMVAEILSSDPSNEPPNALSGSRMLDVARMIDPYFRLQDNEEVVWSTPIHMVYQKCVLCEHPANVELFESEYIYARRYRFPKRCTVCRGRRRGY